MGPLSVSDERTIYPLAGNVNPGHPDAGNIFFFADQFPQKICGAASKPLAGYPNTGYNPRMNDAERHPAIEAAIRIAGSQAALAERIGCAQQHISKLLNREVAITAEMAIRIAKTSGDKVKLSDLRPDLWPVAPSRKRVA